MGGRGSAGSRNSTGITYPQGNTVSERLENMENLEGESKKNLLPLVEDASDLRSMFRQARRENKLVYKDVEVDINSLKTAQNFVDPYILSDIALYDRGIIDGTDRTEDEGILAIQHKGNIVIMDGNHRVNAAILRKQKQIKLRLAQL